MFYRSPSVLVIVLAVGACTRPIPGVLTLAPAGMHTTGACTPRPDGTLTMQAGAAAESVVYVDAGPVTLTVTAKASVVENPPVVELWLAGTSIGTASVQSTENHAYPFHGQARASGPTAVRMVFSGTSAAALDVEKIVITEP
jgi:hypothetical protein